MFLLTGLLPVLPARAAYPIYPGQSILIDKQSLNPAPVILRLAKVESVSTTVKSLVVSLFNLNYTIDAATVTSTLPAVGSYVTIFGTLDASNPTLVHVNGHVDSDDGPPPPFDQGSGPCASGALHGNSPGTQTVGGEAIVNLVRMALNCPTPWVLTKPDSRWLFGGSPNQRLVSRVYYYAWAMKAGTATEKAEAKHLLLEFFSVGEQQGHYFFGGNEVFPTSHYEVWYTGTTGARFFAWFYHDPELLAATAKWWKEEMALDKLLVRDGTIDTPGTRFGGPGQPTTNQLRDVLYLMISKLDLPSNPGGGGKPPGGPGVPNSPWWNDFYNSGPWIMRNLLRLGDDVGGAASATSADLPILHNPFCVYTKGSDYVRWFPVMTDAIQIVSWVARINGVRSHGPYPHQQRTGVDPNDGLPPLDGYSLFVVYGPGHSSEGCVGTPSSDPGDGGDGGDGGNGNSSSTLDSTNARDLISDLFHLRKNTKDAGFSKNPIDKPKILFNLVQMQRKIIELFIAIGPFNANSSNQTITEALPQLQPKFTEFNAAGIVCTQPGAYVPFVNVSQICKSGLERTSGPLNDVLLKLQNALPPPVAGTGEGSGDGSGDPPIGPLDE